MLYTSVVLFFGFGIFALSSFGGTVAMGVLVSLTLTGCRYFKFNIAAFVADGFGKITTTKSFEEPLLHIYDEEEDIELEELEISE